MAMPDDIQFKNTLWDPMPKQIFNALDSIDTGLAWELSRTDVISQLLGPEAYGVPFLDESKLFEPFSVIAKVIVKGRAYLKYIGRLQDLILPCQHPTQFYQTPRRVNDNEITQNQGRISQDYIYRVSNKRGSIKKGIKIRLQKVKCYDIQLRMNVGDLRLNFDKHEHLKGISKIWIIHQTFSSEETSVSVTIGESRLKGRFLETENKKFSHSKRMPIAFSCHRFPVEKDGTIGKRSDSVCEVMREAQWKRAGVSQLPDVPKAGRPEMLSNALRGAIPMDNKEQDSSDFSEV